MSNNGNLPQEIITDILSRLPVKSIFRSKCVSSLWKSLISDPQFARTHLDRTKKTNYPEQKIVTISYCGNLNLVDYKEINPTSTKLEFPTVEQNEVKKWENVWSSCDGLLLVSCDDKSVLLLNPSTRECKKLPVCPFPNPVNITLNSYGVGYDSSTDDYKVLKLSYWSYDGFIGSYITKADVYSLKTNAWRRIEDSQYQFSDQNKHLITGYIMGHSGVFLNGCLHFLWNRTFCGITIIVFDLSSEIVQEMQLPYYVRKYQHLVVLGGCLCLVDAVAREIWMLKEYGERESWTKFRMWSGDSTIDALWMLAEDEFLLLENAGGRKQLIVYNPRKLTKRLINGTPTNFILLGTCVESLISPFHVQGIGRLQM